MLFFKLVPYSKVFNKIRGNKNSFNIPFLLIIVLFLLCNVADSESSVNNKGDTSLSLESTIDKYFIETGQIPLTFNIASPAFSNIEANIGWSAKSGEDFSQFVRNGKKIIGIGRNYRWTEAALADVIPIPEEPIIALKPTTSYLKEGRPIELPMSLGEIFYEVELGLVIGKRGKFIQKTEALNYVAGYVLALDLTAAKFVNQNGTALPWSLGKGFDTSCPISEFIPKALIPNPNNVDLECSVNGEVTQSDNTSQMIFSVEEIISYVSKYMTLEPNDVILTGTPDGFGPIKGGDIIEARLGGLTSIKFSVVDIPV